MTRVVPQIGLTGSIGSGKSAVAELFRTWGSKILDADDYARQLLAPDTKQSRILIEKLGPQITRPDGSLDRFALRSLIFSDSEAKKELEFLLHPEIRTRILADSQKLLNSGCLSVTLVIPLLFEGPLLSYANLTHTVVVSARKEICLQRASKRDSCSTEIINKIFDSQMSPLEKENLADYVIDNNGSIEDLTFKSRQIFNLIHAS